MHTEEISHVKNENEHFKARISGGQGEVFSKEAAVDKRDVLNITSDPKICQFYVSIFVLSYVLISKSYLNSLLPRYQTQLTLLLQIEEAMSKFLKI